MFEFKYLAGRRPWAHAGALIALISLASALALESSRASSPLSDRVLAQTRGANPQVRKISDGGCTTVNVRVLNTFDPPEGPRTAVAEGDCLYGLTGSTICIACLTKTTWLPVQSGGPPNVDPVNPILVDCGLNKAGTQGTCMLDSSNRPYCGNQSGYSCDTTGADYPAQ